MRIIGVLTTGLLAIWQGYLYETRAVQSLGLEGEYLIGSRTREPPPHLHPCPLIFIIRNTLIHSTGTVEHRAQCCKLKMKLGGLTNQNVIISSIVLVVLPFRRILFFSFYYLGGKWYNIHAFYMQEHACTCWNPHPNNSQITGPLIKGHIYSVKFQGIKSDSESTRTLAVVCG